MALMLPEPDSARVGPSPQVSGLTVREAEQRLHAAGFRFNPVGDRPNTYRFVDDLTGDRAPDSWRVCWPIWDHDLETLDLWVAPACVIRMPLLIGKRLRHVEKALYTRGLFYDGASVDPRYVVRVDIGRDWVVCEQVPRPGSRVSLRRIQHLVRLKLARPGRCP